MADINAVLGQLSNPVVIRQIVIFAEIFFVVVLLTIVLVFMVRPLTYRIEVVYAQRREKGYVMRHDFGKEIDKEGIKKVRLYHRGITMQPDVMRYAQIQSKPILGFFYIRNTCLLLLEFERGFFVPMSLNINDVNLEPIQQDVKNWLVQEHKQVVEKYKQMKWWQSPIVYISFIIVALVIIMIIFYLVLGKSGDILNGAYGAANQIVAVCNPNAAEPASQAITQTTNIPNPLGLVQAAT